MPRLIAFALLATVPLLAACGASVDESVDAPAPAAAALVAQVAETPAAGVRAADGSASFIVRGHELLRFDPATRRQTRTYDLGGVWRLGGVSANGRWAGLTRPGTTIRVLDTETGTISDEIELSGDFAVETISVAGDFLFLQQNFVDGTYAVRGYDLARDQMLPGSLGTKGETVKMQGRAGQVVASPDGEWLLTLYVNTKSNTAFVHALNLVDKVPLCIVLPPCEGECDDSDPEDWTLKLRTDGRTLVATHPAQDRAVIDLSTGKVVA
jgi:hypothetical protein